VSARAAVSSVLKIIFLLVLNLVILLGGLYWFDRLGVLDYQKLVGPLMRYLPAFLRRGEPVVEDPLLLDKEFLGKKEQVLSARERELALVKEELERKTLTLQEQETKLAEEAKHLDEEKKVLSEKISAYDNYKENIKKQAQYFTSMPPREAVERLELLDELLAIDILRQIDQNAQEQGKVSIVPFYLSRMDKSKAASIQRKMTKTDGGE